MPYCPKCRDEFQHWVRVCPDCEAALVEQLPVQSKREETDEPLVYIATALNESVASMWSGILEEHGIHCLFKSANLRAAMYAFTYNMTCRIHVLASETERAKEMLSPFLKADTEKEV